MSCWATLRLGGRCIEDFLNCTWYIISSFVTIFRFWTCIWEWVRNHKTKTEHTLTSFVCLLAVLGTILGLNDFVLQIFEERCIHSKCNFVSRPITCQYMRVPCSRCKHRVVAAVGSPVGSNTKPHFNRAYKERERNTPQSTTAAVNCFVLIDCCAFRPATPLRLHIGLGTLR